MAGIDEVLERLITDPEFKERLEADPQAALEGYELTEDDLGTLASQLSDDVGGQSAVEQRTSKAGLLGLFTGLFGQGQARPGARSTPVSQATPSPPVSDPGWMRAPQATTPPTPPGLAGAVDPTQAPVRPAYRTAPPAVDHHHGPVPFARRSGPPVVEQPPSGTGPTIRRVPVVEQPPSGTGPTIRRVPVVEQPPSGTGPTIRRVPVVDWAVLPSPPPGTSPPVAGGGPVTTTGNLGSLSGRLGSARSAFEQATPPVPPAGGGTAVAPPPPTGPPQGVPITASMPDSLAEIPMPFGRGGSPVPSGAVDSVADAVDVQAARQRLAEAVEEVGRLAGKGKLGPLGD